MNTEELGRAALAWAVKIAPLRWAVRQLSLRGHLPPSVWKRLPPPPGPFTVAVGDRSFSFDASAGDILPRRLYWRGMEGHEAETFRAIAPLMSDVRSFVDVGANVGLFSLYVCASNETATAVAFEAVDRVADKLRLNLDHSGFSARVTVHEQAVSDQNGTVRFIIPVTDVPATSRLSSAQHCEGGTPTKEVEVPCVTLDDALADLTPDLMKIDVEGAEDIVLRGGVELLGRAKPALILEVLPEGPHQALDDILQTAGYRIWSLRSDGPVATDHVEADPARKDRNILALHRDDPRCERIGR